MPKAFALMYHHISPEPTSVWHTHPDRLAETIAACVEAGYRFCHAREFLSGADKVAMLTFDDAYRCVLERAAPIVRAFDVPATLFVPTDFVGKELDGYPVLSWPELRALSDAGWSLQSHGCSHRPFTDLTAGQMRTELAKSKRILERQLGRPVDSFAYPFGMVPQDAGYLAALASSGYACAFLATGGPIRIPPDNRFLIPRVTILNGMMMA